MDLKSNTLAFYINGNSQGYAFDNVTGPIYPAVTLYSRGDHVTINAAVKLPSAPTDTSRAKRLKRKSEPINYPPVVLPHMLKRKQSINRSSSSSTSELSTPIPPPPPNLKTSSIPKLMELRSKEKKGRA